VCPSLLFIDKTKKPNQHVADWASKFCFAMESLHEKHFSVLNIRSGLPAPTSSRGEVSSCRGHNGQSEVFLICCEHCLPYPVLRTNHRGDVPASPLFILGVVLIITPLNLPLNLVVVLLSGFAGYRVCCDQDSP
jgi:hypothetical protein